MKTFINQDLENQFTRDGYVVVRVIDEPEIQYLTQLYKDHYEAIVQPGFNSSFEAKSPELNRALMNGFHHVFQPVNERLFVDHNLIFGAFLIKKIADTGEVGPHMDWTFVDEDQYCSANMWCPMIDVNQSNGGISLLKGCHRFTKSLRGDLFPNGNYDFKNIVPELLKTRAVHVELKKGEAVILDHRAIHFSGINQSDTDRVACGVSLVPKKAEIYHYFMHPNGRVSKYIADTEFMINYQFGIQPSDLYKIDEFDYTEKQLTLADITD